MEQENMVQPLNILLSREELLFILGLLDTRTLPGIEPEPSGALTPEQEAWGRVVTERGLRARGLIRVRDDGQLVVQDQLLEAVGVCAYAQQTMAIHHWHETSNTPLPFYSHTRGATTVVHTCPEDVLHLFSILPSNDHLWQYVLQLCDLKELAPQKIPALTVEYAVLQQVRELAEGGDVNAGISLLSEHNVPNDVAQPFVKTLSNPHRASIFQTIKQNGKDEIEKRDFTLLQNGHVAWLMLPVSRTEEAYNIYIQTTTKTELEELLPEWM